MNRRQLRQDTPPQQRHRDAAIEAWVRGDADWRGRFISEFDHRKSGRWKGAANGGASLDKAVATALVWVYRFDRGALGGLPALTDNEAAELESLPEGVSVDSDEGDTLITYRGGTAVRTVDDLIAEAGVDPKWYAAEGSARTWTTAMKVRDADGAEEPVIVQNHAVSLRLRRLAGDELPISITAPITIVETPRPAPPIDDVLVCLFIPDIHFSFYREGHDTLAPCHDVRALDVIAQLAGIVRPHRTVLLGDPVDNPTASRFDVPPEYRGSANLAYAAGFYYGARLRAAVGPDGQITSIEGNHGQDRNERSSIANGNEMAMNQRPGEDLPVNHPHYLMRWNDPEIRIDLHRGGYRGGGGYLNIGGPRGIDACHHFYGAPNAVISKMLKSTVRSTVSGHGHKRFMASRRVRFPGERPMLHTVFSPGCVCRTDGAVPGASAWQYEDWDQGAAVGYLDANTGDVLGVDIVGIEDGKAFFGGRLIVGEDWTQDLAEATGIESIGRWRAR